MKTILILLFSATISLLNAQKPTGKDILEKIDENMATESQIVTSKMIIHGARTSRTIEAKTWTIGEEQSFTEYLSPAREQGTKMLKLDNKLWIYSPSTDRTIQISGHMLRQSLMGSDLSYEDMMENSALLDSYDATIVETAEYNSTVCYVLELQAKTKDVAYQMRKMWIDKEKYIPLKEEWYAKSGQLLKKIEMSDMMQFENRWYPKKIVFKDMLKKGDGTEFIVDEIEFNPVIPEHIFTKASLR